MPRLIPALLLTCLLAPALSAQGIAAATRWNGRTEVEGGASILDIQATDRDGDTHFAVATTVAALRWDDGPGAVRIHGDAFIGVDRWRWTAGPFVDFEDPSRPGAGLRLTGGYELLPHATLALAFETLTAPRGADGRSAGTHGSLGLMFRVAF